MVAPLAGAWIEMSPLTVGPWSHGPSHPSRVRGLKCFVPLIIGMELMVAPLAGAWIEIVIPNKERKGITVAPLAGAWIEILKK